MIMPSKASHETVKNLQKVFVYGTLKRGEPNHYWLTNSENGYSRFICEAKTQVKYPLVIGTRYNIPFLLDKPGVGHLICGEVYEVDKKMFKNLDVLEDYPNYYDREVQQISCDSGKIDCWLYIMRNFPEPLLNKKYLKSYHNSSEQPYCESYLASNKDDMYEYDELQPMPV